MFGLKLCYDWRLGMPFRVALIGLVACMVSGIWIPQQCCEENGIVENLQLATMVAGVTVCCFAGKYREFFYWCAAVMLMLLLREISCGRTLFLMHPGSTSTFYKWREVPYGWLVHVVYGVFIAGVVLWFIFRRLYRSMLKLLNERPLPMWTLIIFVLDAGVAFFLERSKLSIKWEELFELSMFISLLVCICYYSRFRNTPMRSEKS